MATQCQELLDQASAGVAPALRAVDCVTGETVASAFDRLAGPDGALTLVLAPLLTIYVAIFGFQLLTGRSTLGISALTPRMMTLGLVLTFATSWIAYQSIVWNLAVGGPDWIASVLMGSNGSATMMFGDRIDIVFGAVDQIASSQNGNAEGGGAAAGPASMMSPQGIMYLGAVLLLLGTVGVLLTARIVLAVLLALGPVFVIMGVFSGTRGLTAGWVRGVVLTALTPLFVVLSGGISLELLVPILSRLNTSAQMGEIDGRAAMAFFLVSSVHVALMVLVMKITTTMVTGWQVFGLGVGERSRGEDRSYPSAQAAPAAGAGASAYAQAPAASASRSAAMVAAASAPAASVAAGGPGGDTTSSGERRTTVVTQISGGGIEPLRSSGTNERAKGIGSRFRSPSNDTGKTAGGSHARPPREMLR